MDIVTLSQPELSKHIRLRDWISYPGIYCSSNSNSRVCWEIDPPLLYKTAIIASLVVFYTTNPSSRPLRPQSQMNPRRQHSIPNPNDSKTQITIYPSSHHPPFRQPRPSKLIPTPNISPTLPSKMKAGHKPTERNTPPRSPPSRKPCPCSPSSPRRPCIAGT
jgi:hypothetical protein